MKNPKLKPWLDSGISRIAKYGLSGINVSEMADEIKIAKSSFYHYFTTKDEYLNQLLEYWEQEGTIRIIKDSLLHPDLEQPVRHLLDQVFEFNFVHEFVLQQFRTSSIDNKNIHKKVAEIDQIRVSFLTVLINKSGYTGTEAKKKAKQVYIFFLGNLSYCNLKSPNKKEIQLILDDFSNLFGKI